MIDREKIFENMNFSIRDENKDDSLGIIGGCYLKHHYFNQEFYSIENGNNHKLYCKLTEYLEDRIKFILFYIK